MPASTARPTIDKPTKGAKTSGKSVSTSIVNMQCVFNLRRFVALLSAPRSPYDAAVRELDLGHAERALCALDRLLEGETSEVRKAEIQNKRGVAFVRLERRAEAAKAF